MGADTVIQEEQSVVLAQLKSASPELHFFIGTGNMQKSYTKDEMKEHVLNLDEIGTEYIKIQMDFLRAFKTGEFQKILMSE